MKPSKEIFSRRNFLKTGLGALGALAGSAMAFPAFAQGLFKGTPRQPLGPFFPDDGDPQHEIRESQDFTLPISQASDNDLTFIKGGKGNAQGQVVYIKGKVFSRKRGESAPLAGAAIILWNASASGRYNHRGDRGNTSFKHPKTGERMDRTHDEYFQYWGRCLTDEQGAYWFKTIVPGFYPADLRDPWYRPPHLHFLLTAPGVPQLVTQLYFKGNEVKNNDFIQELNARDYLLRSDRLKPEEQESLIIEYKKDAAGERPDGLVGHYDFIMTG